MGELIEDGKTGFLVDDVAGAVAAVERAASLDRAAIRARQWPGSALRGWSTSTSRPTPRCSVCGLCETDLPRRLARMPLSRRSGVESERSAEAEKGDKKPAQKTLKERRIEKRAAAKQNRLLEP